MLNEIRKAEQSLIATIGATADELDAVGGSDVRAALVRLEQAQAGAIARLDEAAGRVRGVLAGMLRRVAEITATLSADLAGQAGAAPAETRAAEASAAETPAAEAPADADSHAAGEGPAHARAAAGEAPADPELLEVVRGELQAWGTGAGVEETTYTSRANGRAHRKGRGERR